jgi:hypothetical protein
MLLSVGAAAATLRKPSCGSRPVRIDPFKDGDRRTVLSAAGKPSGADTVVRIS